MTSTNAYIMIAVSYKIALSYKKGEKQLMKISIKKLELAKARACMSTNDIIKAGIPKGTYNRITTTKTAKAVTIGKIARILNVDVTELLED